MTKQFVPRIKILTFLRCDSSASSCSAEPTPATAAGINFVNAQNKLNDSKAGRPHEIDDHFHPVLKYTVDSHGDECPDPGRMSADMTFVRRKGMQP